MSKFTDNPEMVLTALAKLVHKNGGYVKLTMEDQPTGPFNLMSRIDEENRTVELRLLPTGVDANSDAVGTA